MKYTASNPITGNTTISYESQEAADAELKFLDENNCYNCTNCYNCYNCTNCYDCNNCDNCYDCNGCDNCNNCYDCNNCNNCTNCINCTNCTNCYNCNNCDNIKSSLDYLTLGPAQSSGRSTYGYIDSTLNALVVSCGCFKGSLEEFRAIISKTHEDNPIALAQYKAFATCIEVSLLHRIKH